VAEQGTATIPVIDISSAERGSPREAEVIAAIAQACDTVGFFGISGAGVPPDLIDGVYAAARSFFALPAAVKLKVGRPREGVNRGYIAPGTESLARLNFQETPPDFKEVFTVGPDDYPEDDYHTCEQARSYWVRNPWPTALPSFRSDVLAYQHAVEDLAERLSRWFCLALGLPEHFLYDRFASGPSQVRLIHYPPQPDGHAPGQLRAGEHTDLGIFGILHSDSNSDGGLEVKTRDGRWEKAPTFDGFVINIGDALMRWTNDRFVSTPHRVVNPEAVDGGTSRISVVFFPILNYDVIVDSSVTTQGGTSNYEPITFGEYGSARFASTSNAMRM
jgi:isopenicillin N synthase-like dioxygenase